MVIGSGRIAAPAGTAVRTTVRLNAAGRRLLTRAGSIRVQPVVTFKGDTRLERDLAPFTLTRMNERTWLRKALATLYIGGRPRLDLNMLLDDVRAGRVSRATAARRIEREVILQRQRARARAAALPIPHARLQRASILLLRAFDQSLAANRAYVTWLRSDAPRDTRGWRISRRATRTKGLLMQQLAEHGARHRLRVPSATQLWP